MAVTPDNQYLLTASVNGSLLIWTITDQKGRNLSVMKETDHPEEVCCAQLFEDEKINLILQ